MSFENGYNAKDYISGCIDKYKLDNLIFSKALQTITFFANLPQWPHNYNAMKEAVSLIIGEDFGWFLKFMGQYMSFKGNNDVNQIDWSYANESFVSEAEAFFMTTDEFLFRANESRITPLKIYGVVCSKSNFDTNEGTFKFIRNDGQSLEMEMDKEDIKKLSSMLEQILSDANPESYPI